MHTGQPQILSRTGTELPPYAQKVLTIMFAAYSQVIVKSEFQSGFSGSRVFLVRPVRQDGAELPAVIKIDLAARIQREWHAYQSCIQNRLPNVAEIRGEPVYPPGSLWGGLWYPMVGAGTFEIESLKQYLQQTSIEDIRHTLETRLFKSLGVLWSQTRVVQPDLHLQTHYDSFLPMNLVIEPIGLPSDIQTQWLHPSNVSRLKLRIGDFVQLSGFQVVKVSHKTQSFSLDTPPDSDGAYRIQLHPVLDSAAYEVGDIVQQPFIGIVRQTREDLLRGQVLAALGRDIDLTAVSLTLPNKTTLPNPLHALPNLLNHSFDAHVAYIHGDLNLENVLVEMESRTAYLIDFAQSRKDHILRDLFHLEMSVVTNLLSAALRENNLAVEAVCSFYEQLHCAVLHPGQITAPVGLEQPFAILLMIRQAAQRYLFTPGDWSEYFYGLSLYLLGSLRYPNLDKIAGAKAVAFWGTAVILKLLNSAPPCQLQQAQVTPSTQQDSRKPTTQNHFYAPVSGPIHTGTGNINITSPPQSEKTTQPHPKPRYEDTFSAYENGLNRMLAQLGPAHARYGEALVYQQRLTENISRTRRFGDTNLRQADRAEIIDQLNELALSSLGISFNQLCVLKNIDSDNLELYQPHDTAPAHILDAAIAREIVVGKPTELVAQVRLENSTGLKGILQLDIDYDPKPEDVKSRSVQLEFPLDEQQRPKGIFLLLKVSSLDFDPPAQIKKVIVPPDTDSEPCVFQLIPRRVGQLGILLEVYDPGEVVTASTKIRVHCQESEVAAVGSENRILVSLPLAAEANVYPKPEKGAVSMNTFAEIKKKTLQQRLAEQLEEYKAVNAQLGRVLDEGSRLRLERQAEHLAGEISKIEAELSGLDASTGSSVTPTSTTPTLPVDQVSVVPEAARLRLQLLRKSEGEMVVRGVAVPGGGIPRATVPLPYTLTQLPAILKALDVGAYDPERFKPEYVQALTDLGLLHENRLHPDFHAKVGQTLYQALFAGEIGDELRQAQRSGQSIVCELAFEPEDVLLAQFPWELIHDAANFCTPRARGIAITRSIAFATPPPQWNLQRPLRLLLISPRPEGEDELTLQATAVQTGLAALANAEQVTCQTLTPPTWAALEETLYRETFDIIHFDGHGSYARECPACGEPHYPSQEKCVKCQADMRQAVPQGYLHFEDGQGKLDRVKLSDMQMALADSSAQLVFLSACSSGVTHGVSVFNGIAPALIRIGIPAVVAMQASPPDGSSTLFVQRFYDSLVQGTDWDDVAVAVGNGRRAIFRPLPGEPVSWFMPVVYLRQNNAK